MTRLSPALVALSLFASVAVAGAADPAEFGEFDASSDSDVAGSPVAESDIAGTGKDAALVQSLDVYASDKAAQVIFENNGQLLNLNNGRMYFGFLFNEERDNVLTAGIVLDATPHQLPGVRLSFGGKAYAGLLGLENADVIGFSMGVETSYDPGP